MLLATAPITDFLQHLRASRLRDQDATDGQLLEVFAARRDESAFEALVRRHGAMVLGACRRILRNNHDAEDAFQATFLVLACKAAVIRPRHMVAGWLYGVACNTALKLRGTLNRRRVKEREAAAMPRPQSQPDAWRQLEPLLDDALRGLPEKYRVPIVLCDLESKSRKEAARQLGWPEGTVATRLARGRQMLARRLGRHGLALSASAVATIVSENLASACVPPALVKSLAKIGPLIAAGEMPAANALSTGVAQLTQGVLQAMFMTKVKVAAAFLLVLTLLAFAATWYPTSASPQVTPPRKAQTGPPPPDQLGGNRAEQTKATAPVTLELPAVVVDEVDLKYKTISVTIVEEATGRWGTSSSSGTAGTGSSSSTSTDTGKPAKLVNVPVDKHVEIYIDKRLVPLGSLKPGMKVSLRLTANGGRLVAAAIGSGPRGGDDTTALEVKEALAQAEVAMANVDVAAIQWEKAKATLAKAVGNEARDTAQAEVEVAARQLEEARAIAARAQELVARIRARYELERQK
jgi:RNA polymerase sigma factor (sigma-70 family)